ncbi:Unknown protein, partial [Striga hermonthica]
DFRAAWTDKRPPSIPGPRPPLQVLGFPPFGGHAPSGVRIEEETPITSLGVKIPGITQGEPSQVKGTNTRADDREPTETTLSLGKQSRVLEQVTMPPPQVEEQMMTVTRSEMQRMIAEAVAARLEQVQVENPRLEQPRIEQPR